MYAKTRYLFLLFGVLCGLAACHTAQAQYNSSLTGAQVESAINKVLATDAALVDTNDAVITQVSTNATDIGSIESAIASLSAFETQLGGVNLIVSTEIDTLGEIETLIGGINLMDEDEVDAKLAAIQSANVAYDDSASGPLATDNSYNGMPISGGVSAEAIPQFSWVHRDASGKWALADDNYPATALAVTSTAAADQAIVVVKDGTVRNDSLTLTTTLGSNYIFLDPSTGGLTQTAPSTSGDTVQLVGIAKTADQFDVEISAIWFTVE